MSRDSVVESLSERHEGVHYVYTTCVNNGCWDASCILKCAVKDNKIISIEPDDSINVNDGREDVDDKALNEGMIQLRACPMGHAWRQELYAEDRLLYPMKRVGGKGAGRGHFERISWEEALDTIAAKMGEISEKYGEASIAYCQYSAFEHSDLPLAPWLKGALATWGDHSTSGGHAGEEFFAGVDLVDIMFKGTSQSYPGFEAPDLFNSDLIVLWGFDPLVGWFGTVPYYMKLAKERGCKVICIEPRYTVSAEVLADQWIPIRPGTDMALQLAVAYVLYTEELYDHEFVERYVEPAGFASWRAYVVGEAADGVAKTPEWAAPITGIPVETIREFARLYGRSKAVHLQAHYSISKRNLGDYAGAGAMLLQAMTGNIARPGGCETGCCLVTMPHVIPPSVDWGRAPADFFPPVVCNNNKITEAIYCRPLYDAGEMPELEYRRRIGAPADSPLPNIKMLVMDNNYANNQHNVNKRMRGYASMEFSWGWQWHEGQPSAEFLDIVLPAPIHQFETMDTYFFGQERMFLGPCGMRNYFVYCGKAVDPPGEVRPKEWVWMQIAKRLGIGEKYSAKLVGIDDPDEWTRAVENLYREAYEEWAKDEFGMLAASGIEPAPWEEFVKKPVVRAPIDEPFYPFKNVMEQGESPFITPSGKFEFESNFIKNNPLKDTKYRGEFCTYPVWQPPYQDVPANDSYYHPKTGQYPLSLVTPVTSYRQHSANDKNPWMRDDVYKHAVWISAADAYARDIKDGDMCSVYNEYGEVHIPAFVTSRTIPGTVSIHHGSWYRPDTSTVTDEMPFGIDKGGNCNLLIGDTHLPHIVGALLTAGLVQVKKLGGEQ